MRKRALWKNETRRALEPYTPGVAHVRASSTLQGSRSNVQANKRPRARPFPMDSPVALKVMTFNLRRRKESDGPNAWDERRDAAAEVIRRHAPDLIGTQEGLREQVGFLQQHFSEYGI